MTNQGGYGVDTTSNCLKTFLFSWARMLVIQPGSIVLLAFVLGDYATQLLPLGAYSSSLYAIAAIALFTGLNLLGIRQGKGTQNALAIAELLGLLLIIGVGLVWTPSNTAATSVEPATSSNWGSILLSFYGLKCLIPDFKQHRDKGGLV